MAGRTFVSRFSPNRTDPKVLEAIFVQRHKLADVWLERLRDSILTDVKHHLLAVGPRGCGKSHLVALLIGRLRSNPTLTDRVRIAWLPEDETTPSFWKFLLRILRALNAEYGDEFPALARDQLADTTDERRSTVLIDHLLKHLDRRTLLVVVENLDDVLRGLKDEGQKRWRAFLQEHRVAVTLATSQQLTQDVSDHDRPFFNFFQIEHLQPLTADGALALLLKIAELTGNKDLIVFLQTPTGRARVRAIRHIGGGSHRLFIILSEFASRANLDDLVQAFDELLDELTPYYQERLRWLPDQQREIVEFLCRQARTVPVKDIAGELFHSEQTAAAQLKSLRDKGYVTAGSVGRESRYELTEPLMRLCVEVKDPQHEPIRLIVEFLQVWYDRSSVEARLQCLSASADVEQRYLRAALKAYRPGVPGPVEEALDRDLEAARASGHPEEVVRVLVDLGATADEFKRCYAVAVELLQLNRHTEALSIFSRVLELDPKHAFAWSDKGAMLNFIGRAEEALAAYDRAIELDPRCAWFWSNKGCALNQLGRHAEALTAHLRATELNPNFAAFWTNMGNPLHLAGQHIEALAAYDRAIELDPNDPYAWSSKGNSLNLLGRHAEALAAHDRVVELDAEDPTAWCNKGNSLNLLGRKVEALAAYDRAIELDPEESSAWINKGFTLNLLGRHAEALVACDRATKLVSESAHAWENYGRAKLGLGEIGEAAETFQRAIGLNANHSGAFEGLAEARVLQANWAEAEKVLCKRFRLRSATNNLAHSNHLPDLLATIFRVTTDHDAWTRRVDRLADIAQEVRKKLKNMKPDSPNPLALLGDSLVRSLNNKCYADANPTSLNGWVEAWKKVAKRHRDLSLPVRLFIVGCRYLQTKDERVLLDLVQDERAILRDLFELAE